jgi:hypothetical protein
MAQITDEFRFLSTVSSSNSILSTERVPPIEGEEWAQGRGAAGCAIILGIIRQPRGFDRTHAVHAQKCSGRAEIVALDLSFLCTSASEFSLAKKKLYTI